VPKNALIAAFASLLLAASAGAQEPKLIRNPDWVAKPTGWHFQRYYPPAAMRRGIGGAALIRCEVNTEGRLERCVVRKELPPGYGFGQAALAMAALFRMSPRLENGKPVGGAEVGITITFTVGGGGVRVSFQPGDPAILVTEFKGGPSPKDPRIFDCPSRADPERKCRGHAMEWAQRPDRETMGRLLEAADQGSGISHMECRAGAGGALEGCLVEGATPATKAALLEYARGFRAPAKAADGMRVSKGRILLEFDWDFLTG
jgi:TonB family protein